MKKGIFRPLGSILMVSLTLQFCPSVAKAADQPQWGQAWSRNMVSQEKGLPDTFDPKTGANIKWKVPIGTETHSTPIVAGGRVYIGTNNEEPRDPNHKSDSGVLMCFEEKTGAFLWQLVVPKREEDIYHDWPKTGWASPVTVEGDRVYVVSNRGEVMCLDAKGMANGNDGPYKDEAVHMLPRRTNAPVGNSVPQPTQKDGDIIWLFDLTKEAGIWSHDGAHSSILIHGDYLYLNSGTGVDNTHKRIRTPDAPSLVVLNKKTGKLVARDNEHIAPDIFHCTWSSPSMGVVNGRDLLFFCAGNGIVFAFETLTSNRDNLNLFPRWLNRNSPAPAFKMSPNQVQKLKKVWQFDFDPTAPKQDIHRYLSNRKEGPSDFYGMPVFYENRLYVAGGGDLWWGKNEAWLKCIDATKSGDITTNGLIWSYPLQKHVLPTPAIKDGLIFIADCGRTFHCVDAITGKAYWTQEIKGEIWASPLVADGKVYLGTRSGEMWVFAASKEKKVLSTIEMGSPISGTATAANGVLFVATMKNLFAVQKL
ncbi:PQQ-binding-like beta-propeller repeat protein [Pedosphaera parvula]|uniref:Pyrrolo-quinoline quinone n=1 Tax=Pedosphaera parvula (strain Ellin514) TaxID=320771 RepID=B9XKG2_PEDPL|nr:PQQ-binding-like beta-propeller repeat protein [Pedosphaera parvula]EEF59632.1 Pyrrolo-quinoline quinone [Pedosphaera parvula Ellin514]